jgi:3-dehydroquinate dehydratase-1
VQKNPRGIYIGPPEQNPPRLTLQRPSVCHLHVTRSEVVLDPARPLVAGSFGNAVSLRSATPAQVAAACDLVEIRLDLLEAEGMDSYEGLETFLGDTPLLFTARRRSEGGAGDLDAAARSALLKLRLDHASLVDVELESMDEMADLLTEIHVRKVPWVASWHDFDGLPGSFDLIPVLAEKAAAAGAACFKAAIRLHSPRDLDRLADCLLASSPIPLSLMGMGALAPVSRLLAAQCGSVLNYGYIGDAPTAPGQWSALQLREGIRELRMLPRH